MNSESDKISARETEKKKKKKKEKNGGCGDSWEETGGLMDLVR
jgi:hypothetical protein